MSNLARYHRIREWAVALLGGVCVECGTDEDLHFDHIDPTTKEAHLTDLFKSGSRERIDRELAKCQLLCRSCHSIKTAQDRRTLVMYAT